MKTSKYIHVPSRLGDAGPGYDPHAGAEMFSNGRSLGNVRGRLTWFPGDEYHYERTDMIQPDRIQSAGSSLPEDDTARNNLPMFDGLVAYFPNALAAVAEVSKIGNDQHNPGEPMHWARGKSTDHGNKMMRHLVDIGKKDARGVRHSARLAWRALANLQEELEREEGAPLARGATL